MSHTDGAGAVLIVDDDEDLREVVAAVLAAQGYVVVVAASGAETLVALRSGRVSPSLILLDLRMPGMTGEEVKAELDADPRWANVPVLVFSGDADAPAVARHIGVQGVIQKPIELEALLEAVEQAMHPRLSGVA